MLRCVASRHRYAPQLAVLEPCVLPSAPTVDRCLYDPTGAAASGAAHHRRRDLLATAAGSSVQVRRMNDLVTSDTSRTHE